MMYCNDVICIMCDMVYTMELLIKQNIYLINDFIYE